jgi:hypothetical protein
MSKLTIFISLVLISVNTQAQLLSTEQKVQILIDSYPLDLSHQKQGYLYSSDGQKWLIDDTKIKSHQAALNNPDIEDTLAQNYSLIDCAKVPKRDFDPGRIRHQKLMMSLFGNDKEQVKQQLQSLDWFGKSVAITKMQQVDVALKTVRAQLLKYPALKPYVAPTAGVFNWRFIKGTERLSVHSYAAAIDVNVKYADYWKWKKVKPGSLLTFNNKYPEKLIKIFEDNGFIWGGAWYHYDTMHFEYRPELIEIAKQQGCT